MGDDLLGVRAVGRGERLPFALGRVRRLGEDDALHSGGRLVRCKEVADLRLERDAERVLTDRRLEPSVGGRAIVELGRFTEGRRGGAGDPDGVAGDPVRLGGREDVRAREAPRTVDEDPDPEAVGLP
jgi:hypothetical protein